MSIARQDFYHGAALSLIVDHIGFAAFARVTDLGSSAYTVNYHTGLYIKFTERDEGPWTFNFNEEHQEHIRRLLDRHGRVFVLLVCGTEGVCALEYGEYRAVIDENFREQENLTVDRPFHGSFRVRGARGQLDTTVPMIRFPRDLFEASQEH